MSEILPPPAPPPVATDPPPAAEVAPPAAVTPAPALPTAFVNPYAARPAAPPAEAASPPAPKAPAPSVTDLHKSLSERDAELVRIRGEAAALHTTVASHAATQLAGLPANVRAAVEKRAGGDPIAVLSMIDTMREAGVLSAPPAALAPLPLGATTAPPPPSAAAPASDPDAAILARYEQMKKIAPTHAGAFAANNAAAIKRAQSRVS